MIQDVLHAWNNTSTRHAKQGLYRRKEYLRVCRVVILKFCLKLFQHHPGDILRCIPRDDPTINSCFALDEYGETFNFYLCFIFFVWMWWKINHKFVVKIAKSFTALIWKFLSSVWFPIFYTRLEAFNFFYKCIE
jgi:hypothetical protein